MTDRPTDQPADGHKDDFLPIQAKCQNFLAPIHKMTIWHCCKIGAPFHQYSAETLRPVVHAERSFKTPQPHGFKTKIIKTINFLKSYSMNQFILRLPHTFVLVWIALKGLVYVFRCLMVFATYSIRMFLARYFLPCLYDYWGYCLPILSITLFNYAITLFFLKNSQAQKQDFECVRL